MTHETPKHLTVAPAHPTRRMLLAMPLATIASAWAQGPSPPAGKASASALGPRNGFEALVGAWVRPDGGYLIVVKSIGVDGALEAMYYNPRPLPFASAKASREGGAVHARFELVAGGYNGSTYDLRYDPASDRLLGTYYQAVAKQSFDVQFSRR
jgi:hypothetical protein